MPPLKAGCTIEDVRLVHSSGGETLAVGALFFAEQHEGMDNGMLFGMLTGSVLACSVLAFSPTKFVHDKNWMLLSTSTLSSIECVYSLWPLQVR